MIQEASMRRLTLLLCCWLTCPAIAQPAEQLLGRWIFEQIVDDTGEPVPGAEYAAALTFTEAGWMIGERSLDAPPLAPDEPGRIPYRIAGDTLFIDNDGYEEYAIYRILGTLLTLRDEENGITVHLRRDVALGPTCPEPATITNTHTPPDLYRDMAACIERGAYDTAVLFFGLAGVYGRIDTYRVVDYTAHQVIEVLQLQMLDPLTDAQKERFLETLTAKNEKGSPAHQAVCAWMQSVGPPAYHPAYMIQHGMKAFAADATPLKENFDAAAAWAEALLTYVHCETVE